MTKKDFIRMMAEKSSLSMKDAGAALDAFMDVTKEQLQAGEKVAFIGFGTFSVVDKPARTARNPRTGAQIKIEAKKSVKFKAGAELKF